MDPFTGNEEEQDEQNRRIAEGVKLVSDLLPHLRISCAPQYVPIVLILNFFPVLLPKMSKLLPKNIKRSLFRSHRREYWLYSKTPLTGGMKKEICCKLSLALDDIQDPGNRTIIRIADWFGIEHVFCSAHSADVFNPKTIQATTALSPM